MTRHRIGLISDTHGLLRPAALRILTGCDQILHAGDAGKPEVLEGLRRLAPLVAVRGNVDGEWAAEIPYTAVVQVGGALFYLLHDLEELKIDPAAAGMRAVIYGHSHHAGKQDRNGVLFINPGSAGPQRFGLPATLAILTLEEEVLDVDFVTLTR